MKYRTLGRTGWQVSEVGFGMWGMGSWSNSDDAESLDALHRAVALGYNFFDTAWAYGEGRSEQLLGKLIHAFPEKALYTASKIPPKNFTWPAWPEHRLDDTYPYEHMIDFTERTLKNLGQDHIDLMQLHVWDDTWAEDERWQRAVEDLKRQGKIRAFGISINRWEPTNVIRALRTGHIDAVQVIYNIFDQNPEDELFPLCAELNIGVIARVPFDEGSLTGNLTKATTWPKDDWRNSYFTPENLSTTVDRVESLRQTVPSSTTMSELALRFILTNSTVSTVIPGMRKNAHVESNAAASDGDVLSKDMVDQLRPYRWVRIPTRAWAP